MRGRSVGRQYFPNCQVAQRRATLKRKRLPTPKRLWPFGLNPRRSSCAKTPKWSNSPCLEPALPSMQRSRCDQGVTSKWLRLGAPARQPPEMASPGRTAGNCRSARRKTHPHGDAQEHHQRLWFERGRFPLTDLIVCRTGYAQRERRVKSRTRIPRRSDFLLAPLFVASGKVKRPFAGKRGRHEDASRHNGREFLTWGLELRFAVKHESRPEQFS